ncbi:MAG TPA: hypothetical protein PLG31_03030 [Spirochaetota bacterium]|nr:hypothetical protein [Spirochaetota bacterium]
MPENRLKVPLAVSQDLVKHIRLLALAGRRSFDRYLIGPIREAGWRPITSAQKTRKMIERIGIEMENPAYRHTISPRCKRLVQVSLSESMAAVGDASIFFLESMQADAIVASGEESIEFADIIEPPLAEFREVNSTKSERLFRETIEAIDGEELKTAFDPVRLGNPEQKVQMDREVHSLYRQIVVASGRNDIPKCRKLIAGYLIRSSDREEYDAHEVEKVIDALEQREPGFRRDLMDMLEADLYYRITRGIIEGDVAKAIQGIRKYSYVFQGSPDTRHYYDVDRLERALYQIITDKNLWDDLKK